MEWTTRQAVHDDDVARLAFALADDAAQGSPRGSLVAEEISLALIRRLQARGLCRVVLSATKARALAPGERQRVRDLIEIELGGDLTLERMAANVEMSVFHFVRVFRSTFGTTPHQYVLGRRLAAAQRMLFHEPSRPIVDIALACGFASQAHLSDTFRLHLGKTPAAADAPRTYRTRTRISRSSPTGPSSQDFGDWVAPPRASCKMRPGIASQQVVPRSGSAAGSETSSTGPGPVKPRLRGHRQCNSRSPGSSSPSQQPQVSCLR